jgi:WD40 repeat protein
MECETISYYTVVLNEKSLLQVDGSKLAAGLWDGTVVVWHEDGTKSFEAKGEHPFGFVSSLSWNGVEEKSHLFVTGSSDRVNNLKIE